MTEHEEPEREVEDLERRGKQVDDDIAEAREAWERKQADDHVPGATGEPREEMPPPEPDEAD
jgi:hypothetical protein